MEQRSTTARRMTTTPLKTAARVLSLGTLVVASFAAWGIGMQVFSRRESASGPVTAAVESHDGGKRDAVPKESPRPSRSAASDRTAADKTKVMTARETRPTADIADAQILAKTLKQTSQPRIQPEVGRLPTPDEQRSKVESITSERFISSDPFAADPLADRTLKVSQQASRTGNETKTTLELPTTSATGSRETSRITSRLSSMQRQLNELAQVQELAQDQIERQADELEQATQLLQQLHRQKQLDQMQKQLKEVRDARQKDVQKPLDPTDTKRRTPGDEPDLAAEEDTKPHSSKKPSLLRAEPVEGHPEKFSIQFQDAEIGEVLAMLCQLSGLNILVGPGVTGKVPTANLQDVSAEQALDAITKSAGFIYEREGQFVFVSTSQDALQRKQSARKTVTRIFQPRYVAVKDLQALITPLLTKPGGLIAVTSPAEFGLEQSRTKVGGDSLSQTDALVVVDFPEVLERIEQVVTEIDVPPSQVVIEAMILSVKLTDSMKMGVNFALLNRTTRQPATSDNGSIINSTPGFPGPGKTSIPPAAGEFLAQTAGLKYGFIQGDISGFIDALETLTDTSVVAAPSLRVFNKQRAELIIGERLGYKTSTFNGTQTIENINFLEVGTKLLLRPWVAQDGLVRMEIHPERSDGQVTDGLPSSRTTEVTSNVVVRDGTTIVIGGFIEEQANQSQFRIPSLGALPVVGNLFKSKASDSTRTELIVLITPRVVPALDAEYEGSVLQGENERRHEEFRNRQSSINCRSLSQIEYEKAARDFEEGHLSRAKCHIEESLRHNRNDVQALCLRNTIDACNTERSGWFRWPVNFCRKPAEQYHRVGSEFSVLVEPLDFQDSPPCMPPNVWPPMVPPLPAEQP